MCVRGEEGCRDGRPCGDRSPPRAEPSVLPAEGSAPHGLAARRGVVLRNERSRVF